jgi:hypothetical protein
MRDLYPISARQFETDPYRLPPKAVGVFFDGFVSGISSQTIKTVLSATPAMLTNPTAPPKVPTTRLKSVVLSDAPMPASVPTKPCARLDRPVSGLHSREKEIDAVEAAQARTGRR